MLTRRSKVVLEIRIGKAMISRGLDVIVSDMAFSGLMRVKIKLQIAYPHVDRVEVCFLERPTIDYVCKPLGGSLGPDINFIPGLESFIQDQIHANLGPIIYAPNVFPVEVAKMLAGNPVDQAIGILAVTIHGAHSLKNSDKFAGTPDPYIKVSLNGRDELARTKIIKENADPKWNETKYIIVTSIKDSLTLQVFDFNEYRKDKELGTATFALERLEKDPVQENEHIEVMANGKARGNVAVDIRFFPVLEGRKLEDGKSEPPPESNTGIARFCVEQAKDLDGTKSLIGQLSPYAVLLLNGKEIHVSKKLKRTNNPIWDNGYKEILVTDRHAARLGLVIKDDRDISADPIIGTYQIKLNDMMQMMEKGQEWYHLAGAKTGRAKLTLQWKPVALKGVVGGTGGYITPIGVMRLHFQNARGLRNVETVGKSDPYVRVLLSGVEKGRTVTFQNDLDPDWDEVLYVPMHTNRERLTLEVMDSENLGKDRSLGMLEISSSDYIFEDDSGGYLAHTEREAQAGQLKLQGRGTVKGTLNFTCSFYPCLNVVDLEEEEEEKEAHGEPDQAEGEAKTEKVADPVEKENERKEAPGKVSLAMAKKLDAGEHDQESITEEKVAPKIRLSPEELMKHGMI
jgi:Ca2+-dependent lipid-binding protein